MINWRQIQRENFRNVEELRRYLELPEDTLLLKKSSFPLNLPRRLAAKIRKGTLDDPILRQFLPMQEEIHSSGFEDPVQDRSFCKTKWLLQKYQGRMLLVTTGACAMNCRFCFRQNYEYSQAEAFSEELAIIRSENSIEEVILSGGDPLSLSNEKLSTLFQELGTMSHLKRIRFHTRFPIGIPERIDEGFMAILREAKQQVIFCIHTNSAEEFDSDVWVALKKIALIGIPLLSQTVLLRGVNNSKAALKKLFLTLVDHGVIPYYLHQLDPVKGSAHFEVSIEEGRALMKELHAEISGYALPHFVQEEPFAAGKTWL